MSKPSLPIRALWRDYSRAVDQGKPEPIEPTPQHIPLCWIKLGEVARIEVRH